MDGPSASLKTAAAELLLLTQNDRRAAVVLLGTLNNWDKIKKEGDDIEEGEAERGPAETYMESLNGVHRFVTKRVGF